MHGLIHFEFCRSSISTFPASGKLSELRSGWRHDVKGGWGASGNGTVKGLEDYCDISGRGRRT